MGAKLLVFDADPKPTVPRRDQAFVVEYFLNTCTPALENDGSDFDLDDYFAQFDDNMSQSKRLP